MCTCVSSDGSQRCATSPIDTQCVCAHTGKELRSNNNDNENDNGNCMTCIATLPKSLNLVVWHMSGSKEHCVCIFIIIITLSLHYHYIITTFEVLISVVVV